MTRTTTELAPPSPSFRTTPTAGSLATKHDLGCSGPHTRRIFGGIGFRTWSPPAPKPRPYHLATMTLCMGDWVGVYCVATGGRLAITYDLAGNWPHTRRIFRGIGFRAGALGPKAENLPLGHRGPGSDL
ncbi:hypothetical protein AVEN_220542-1 [Araneus ventricosus]|uniref:Uncharacterized protein n=1 Tax=Araneus ventricosus TaxID=182803 RepID=A0A4Y2RND0_ARAVE|nr:hypothetical protein AVEN_220542-1 [Araneus ventricosus]